MEVLAFALHLSDRILFKDLSASDDRDRLFDELTNATFAGIIGSDAAALAALLDHYNARTEEYGRCPKMLGEGPGIDQSAGDWHLWMAATGNGDLPEFWLWWEFQLGLKMRLSALALPERIAEYVQGAK
jgi:hypothetical protein